MLPAEFLKIVNASQVRKATSDKWLRYFQDQQSDETLRLIRQKWAKPETFRIFQVNAVKKVINKRANLYRIAPRRIFTNADQVAMENIYRAANVDIVLKRLSRLTKLLKTTAVQVSFVENQLSLYALTPLILDVYYQNDPQRLSQLIVTHRSTKPENVTFSAWSAQTYTRRDYRGNHIQIKGNQNGVNPYGILPFVSLFDSLPDDQFFIQGGDDLIESQEAINVALCNLWRAVELQAHGQAWASGIPAGEALSVGPERAITLPQGGAFGFAAPNAPITDILEAIQFVMRQIAASNDLSADVFDLDKRSESGAAKHVEQIDLKEARMDDIALWRNYESKIFEVIKVVTNTHNPGTIPDNATVSVDFAELQDNLSENERLVNAQKKLEMGIYSPVDILRDSNPDGYPTREDAMQELLRRKDESNLIILP